MKTSTFRIAATAALVVGLLPASAMAGTRASASKVIPASVSQGPKNGFPNSPGLTIATIKANENAAFKRKSNGT
ncbi:cell division protein FtsN [Novosphingobium hassiacum]|uniref:Cell division protein FtsN n=1 Tax=Novosphingobium hassiacum TaxID=173676 RepID=A0A7W5ZVQ9_9SPHN|nr:hypothetical protein [Novosphingobium hassiacum]MBB3860381.1 cell division protein FtsN [Novosphingobium hassiacum]